MRKIERESCRSVFPRNKSRWVKNRISRNILRERTQRTFVAHRRSPRFSLSIFHVIWDRSRISTENPTDAHPCSRYRVSRAKRIKYRRSGFALKLNHPVHEEAETRLARVSANSWKIQARTAKTRGTREYFICRLGTSADSSSASLTRATRKSDGFSRKKTFAYRCRAENARARMNVANVDLLGEIESRRGHNISMHFGRDERSRLHISSERRGRDSWIFNSITKFD